MKDKLIEIAKGFFWGIIICIIITMCSSCTHTKYVTVPEYHVQYINKTDSIQVHDTLVHEKTTIIQEVDSSALADFGIQLKNQEKAFLVQINDLKRQVNNQKEIVRDTIHQRDSIPYPVVQEVIKTKTDLTGWYVVIILLMAICCFTKYRK